MREIDTSAEATGWPDASKPGVPMNPERDGWHWLEVRGLPARPHFWRHKVLQPDGSGPVGLWLDLHDGRSAASMATTHLYLGPCFTPAEVAAREAARAEAMRTQCADYIAECLAALGLPFSVESVRALPIPAHDALARRIAVERLRVLDEALTVLATTGCAQAAHEILAKKAAALRAHAAQEKQG
jgi:hypothetical protein